MEDEYLDLVDKDDQVIGKDLRSKIYAGQMPKNTTIRVVNLLIFNSKGQLLVPKRSMNRKIFPGCYDFSCGEHVMAGEDYDTAAIRGLKEELGIQGVQIELLTKLVPEEFGTRFPKKGPSAFMKIYKVIHDGPFPKYDQDGIESLNWFTLEEIQGMLKKDRSVFKYDFAVILDWLNTESFWKASVFLGEMKILKEGGAFKVESSSKKGLFYDVHPDKPFCSCPEYKFRLIRTKTPCKHIKAVQELEGMKEPKKESSKDAEIVAFVKEKNEVDSLTLIDRFGEEAVNQLINQGELIEEKGKIRLV